jgi:hypothetical protein
MTIRALGYVTFKTHQVYISKDTDTDRIYCFKATNDRCDLAAFNDADEASDYIIAPLASSAYHVVIAGDPPE